MTEQGTGFLGMNLWNLLRARWGNLVNQYDDVRMDASTNSLQIVEYEHHEVHSGSHYEIEDVVDLSVNNVFDVQWMTPNTAEWAHFTFKLNCESEVSWFIYEAAEFINVGSSLTPINNNRNSANTSSASIAAQTNTNIANANADSSVSAALTVAHGMVGAGRDGGIISRGQEIILKQNTAYCMRGIANAAGYIDFTMEWYEHLDRH